MLLREGDQANFAFRIFFDLGRTPHPRFTPKIPVNGLKMIGKHFSAKLIFQNLTPIFHFWGIFDDPIFFQKHVRVKSNYVYIS